MKRLLAYLFLVLGLGLVFNVSESKGESRGIIVLCLNEKNPNNVTLGYFQNLSKYKKNASFRNGECNYVVDRFLNPRLFQFLLKSKYILELKRYFVENSLVTLNQHNVWII
mgnify:CR=1 FL=1